MKSYVVPRIAEFVPVAHFSGLAGPPAIPGPPVAASAPPAGRGELVRQSASDGPSASHGARSDAAE